MLLERERRALTGVGVLSTDRAGGEWYLWAVNEKWFRIDGICSINGNTKWLDPIDRTLKAAILGLKVKC